MVKRQFKGLARKDIATTKSGNYTIFKVWAHLNVANALTSQRA